jgi:ABC-type branched-subunit amino acid transport system ATPase component
MPTSFGDGPALPPAALKVTGLSAGYGGTPIVSDVSIAAEPKQVVSILGPNGAGKSTLLKAIMGVISPSAGTVMLGDADVTGMRTVSLARLGVGYVPQVRDVFTPLRVRENLEMGGYLLDSTTLHKRIDEVLRLFPALRSMMERPAGKLSGGERKILAIARVLVSGPRVLVLDEPTAGLSPELSLKLLQEYIRQVAARGITILLVEQKAFAALEISDYAYVLVSGRNRLSGTPEGLRAQPGFAETFLGQDAHTSNGRHQLA